VGLLLSALPVGDINRQPQVPHTSIQLTLTSAANVGSIMLTDKVGG